MEVCDHLSVHFHGLLSINDLHSIFLSKVSAINEIFAVLLLLDLYSPIFIINLTISGMVSLRKISYLNELLLL